ncbi:hypothetical protein KCU62_g312, partial [Aureobasidium sp. EXF-3399]
MREALETEPVVRLHTQPSSTPSTLITLADHSPESTNTALHIHSNPQTGYLLLTRSQPCSNYGPRQRQNARSIRSIQYTTPLCNFDQLIFGLEQISKCRIQPTQCVFGYSMVEYKPRSIQQQTSTLSCRIPFFSGHSEPIQVHPDLVCFHRLLQLAAFEFPHFPYSFREFVYVSQFSAPRSPFAVSKLLVHGDLCCCSQDSCLSHPTTDILSYSSFLA